ncbi:MAG TPA: hypothetical protein VJ901_20180 [Thermoanaerobaculia bacterium]|nr:hypothetical protein [Thermoanaerobaculia bacterium]
MNTDEKERQALVQALVAELSAAEPLHLDYELIEAYVDGRCDLIDQEIVSSHAAMCPMCGREVRDLQTFAAQHRRPRRNWLPLAAAAIAACLILAILPLLRPSATVLSLHDGNREVRLTKDGQLSGISGLTIDDERRIANALRSGMVGIPPNAAQLAKTGEALRSTFPATPSAFEPLAPIGCIIVSDRPTFEWTAVPGALYRVEVFSDHFRPVADSGPIDETRWTTPQPLARGTTYVWQVTALLDTVETTSPAPPAPEARFAVLDAANAQEIARLELVQPRSHLALGVAYASAGVTAEAERELQELANENRGSADAQRLLQSLRSH